MTAIDYSESAVLADDPANKEIVERVASKSARLMLFCTVTNASWAADRAIKGSAYPIADITFSANRNAFRLEPGDLFKFTYAPYGIDKMILRVTSIREDDLRSEKLAITAIEDVDYLASAVIRANPVGKADKDDWLLTALTHVRVVETPFVIAGDNISVIPLAAREVGQETGYLLYMSIDGGASYSKIEAVPTYNPFGLLVDDYPADTFQIDDESGFEINFSNDDVDAIQTVTREGLLTGQNLALLGDEVISFQTITPITGNRYGISGVYRGRLDTIRQAHVPGTEFYYIGTANYTEISHNELSVGSNRQFKLIPYSSKDSGDLSEAVVTSLTISGRARKPYMPWNIMANGDAYRPIYSGDVVLTWSPRYRGEGAGLGNPESVTDAAPTWEGCFEVLVFAGGDLVRTVSAINDDEWTYTEAMNLADNGCLPRELLFKLVNYRDDGGHTYKSPETIVKAENPAGCDLGTATTTTTTTTTTSTTTTTVTGSSTTTTTG